MNDCDTASKAMSTITNKNSKKDNVQTTLLSWSPISEYSRNEYDWVLLKCIDITRSEYILEIAELKADGKWYNQSGVVIPNIFKVRQFFDLHQLDKKEVIDDLTMDIIPIYSKINKISKLTDELRYSLELMNNGGLKGLRGIRGCYPGEYVDYNELTLEELDNIDHDIHSIRSYLKKKEN